MKKALSVLLAVMMIAALALTGCGQNTDPQTNEEPTTRTFTDSLGREVTLPTDLTKIAISGPLAQIVVFAIAPEMMVGIANEWSQEAKDLIPGEYYTLPLLGQLYGGKGELNLETLLQSGA
ncbi:MAG: ABC transporter substrate-binding protein, partial [Angelakisella sp.]|nr:ABC transporter substrate-binding protein [Angelakisella sp.]